MVFPEETQEHQLFVKSRLVHTLICISVALAGLGSPGSLRACSVCFGEQGSPMALGLVWGIGALLLVVLAVLGGISAFFIHMARRSRLIREGVGGLAAEVAPASRN
jgi:hypothetical protein